MPHPIKLLIADPRPIVARGLAVAFEETGDFVVRAMCREAGGLSALLDPDRGVEAAVIDAEMFGGDALRTLETIRSFAPGVAVLLLTTRVDKALLDALAHEHVSCISAYSEAQAILSALRALLAGETLLPVPVQRALTQMRRPPPPPLSALLTLREHQVLELAAQGLTVSQIATSLNISHSTAKTHLLRIYEKLDAPNRSAAVANAIARGLLRLSPTAA